MCSSVTSNRHRSTIGGCGRSKRKENHVRSVRERNIAFSSSTSSSATKLLCFFFCSPFVLQCMQLWSMDNIRFLVHRTYYMYFVVNAWLKLRVLLFRRWSNRSETFRPFSSYFLFDFCRFTRCRHFGRRNYFVSVKPFLFFICILNAVNICFRFSIYILPSLQKSRLIDRSGNHFKWSFSRRLRLVLRLAIDGEKNDTKRSLQLE